MPTVTDRPTALVLASGQGLGLAAARALNSAGAGVITHARSHGSAERARRELGALDSTTWDLEDTGATAKGICDLLSRGHKPTILVHNCGGPPIATFEDATPYQWLGGMQSIILSLIEAVRTLRPSMRDARWGRIVVISSIAAKEPMPNLVISSVLRAGLTSLVKCMASSLAPEGITINAVLPGYFQTKRLEAFGDRLPEIKAAIPVRRVGEPHELAALMAFLASNEAAFVTGQAILCDGGQFGGVC